MDSIFRKMPGFLSCTIVENFRSIVHNKHKSMKEILIEGKSIIKEIRQFIKYGIACYKKECKVIIE